MEKNFKEKTKLNLSVDSDLKKDFKHIAISHDSSCSELVELYIKALKVNPGVLGAIKQTVEQSQNKGKHKNKKPR